MRGELQQHGYEVSPGTLYPILHSMEAKGYLTREGRKMAELVGGSPG